MAKRTERQISWEDTYIQKVDYINQVLAEERQALNQLKSQAVHPSDGTSNGTSVVAGNFSLPDSIKTGFISGDKIVIPTGARTPYHKTRDIAAQSSNYGGFQSISEDMYSFPNIEEENIFSPDFIPILALMHSKIAPVLKVNTIILNSGTRKKPIDVDWDAHMGGYAVDIRATGSDRYTIADICWGFGLRGVAVGNSFVHVDAGPDPVSGWSYGSIPAYRGPKSARG